MLQRCGLIAAHNPDQEVVSAHPWKPIGGKDFRGCLGNIAGHRQGRRKSGLLGGKWRISALDCRKGGQGQQWSDGGKRWKAGETMPGTGTMWIRRRTADASAAWSSTIASVGKTPPPDRRTQHPPPVGNVQINSAHAQHLLPIHYITPPPNLNPKETL